MIYNHDTNMDLFVHNLKIAVRNLLKYKLQTVISVLSIAVGIVTLAFAHSVMERVTLPTIYHQPYYDRTYRVSLDSLYSQYEGGAYRLEHKDVIHALKRDGGLECAERIAVPTAYSCTALMEFHLCDSSVLRKSCKFQVMDPEFVDIHGFRSAITGEKIKRLGVGEAIIFKTRAEILFGDKNPVGTVVTDMTGYVPVPFTIVDVCEDFSFGDDISSGICISLGDVEGEQCGFGFHIMSYWIYVVMKEGSAERQLLREINARIEPFGLKASLKREADRNDLAKIVGVNSLVYLISSLILITSIIGFLRMQVQLFWSRRREVSLRIVNGATRWSLFCLFITEALVTITLSVVTAMLMGGWIERYLYTTFAEIVLESENPTFHHLCEYSCRIGVLLFVVCGITIWIALTRICKSRQGLQASMRHSRTHVFRNTMLCVQIAISIAFVCCTLTSLNWADRMFAYYHVPEDESRYKEALLLDVGNRSNSRQVLQEIEQSPNVDRVIPYYVDYLVVENVARSADAKSVVNSSIRAICTKDTSLLSFCNLRPHWLNKEEGIGACVFLNESLYSQYKELGIIDDGTLAIKRDDRIFPIAGTIPDVPYTEDVTSILILPEGELASRCVVLPKPGKHAAAMNEAEEIIRRNDPDNADRNVTGFTDQFFTLNLVRSMRTVAMILGMVSLIVCAMSIYSTIALDTRSRKKEVAIRKAHGALSLDIYRLFGRVYIHLIIVALLIAVPVSLLFNQAVNDAMPRFVRGTLPIAMPCIVGSLAVVAMIALIVGWHIRKVMRVESEELIAKE